MLGRGVARVLVTDASAELFAPEVVEAVREADLFVLNLECCISERGTRWPDPGKPFFFKAPPAAAEALARLGVDCVTLANNHALDFGSAALLDTCARLGSEVREEAGLLFIDWDPVPASAPSGCSLVRRAPRRRRSPRPTHPRRRS
jgi:poly-gamma-glutamate synthesis protein (capsule biosynthesis protein)